MEADKVTKMDAKMVIKSIFREQNVQLELVAGGCADDNVSSRLVGEVVDVVGMVADRQVVEEELDMVEEQVTKVDTNMYKDRDREQNLGSKLLSDDNIVFGGCQGSDWRFSVGDGHVGEQDEGLGGAQVEGQGQQGGRQDVQGLRTYRQS